MPTETAEIVVKRFEIGRFTELVRERVVHRKPAKRIDKECVGAILRRCSASIVAGWLARTKRSTELNRISLTDEERTGHLSQLVEDLVLRLSKPSAIDKDGNAVFSATAVAYGRLRCLQGYTPAMLVHESRILRATIFDTLESNLSSLDFSLVLQDVITIADEVDALLAQSMESYMNVKQKSVVA